MEQNLTEEIRVWVDQFTLKDDGWTALHLATNEHKKDLFFYVYQVLGANIYIRNKNGVSLMHKAAIDNNTYLITYLRDKTDLCISDVDYDGNTPLHYACQVGAELSAYWLIGFGQDVNAVNKEKETALHLLIKSEQPITNTSTVRELIFRGADRNLRNIDNKTPYDLVDEYIESEKMRKDLKKMLGKQPTYYPCFHVKQPMKKLVKSYLTMNCYLAMTGLTMVLLQLFVIPFRGPNIF